jgi:hypothetical protein
MIEIRNAIGEILFFSVFVTIFIELALQASWNKLYFMVGLPLFIRRVQVKPHSPTPPAIRQLESHFSSGFDAPMKFHKLADNDYGFREEIFWIRLYTPIMHGQLSFDYDHRQVIAKGYANWTFILFSLGWLSGIIDLSHWWISGIFLIGFMLVFGLVYLIQYVRFGKVAMLAARDWSEYPDSRG